MTHSFTPEQILKCVAGAANWTTEKYIRAADYLANNIQEVTAAINEALKNGAWSLELDIPDID